MTARVKRGRRRMYVRMRLGLNIAVGNGRDRSEEGGAMVAGPQMWFGSGRVRGRLCLVLSLVREMQRYQRIARPLKRHRRSGRGREVTFELLSRVRGGGSMRGHLTRSEDTGKLNWPPNICSALAIMSPEMNSDVLTFFLSAVPALACLLAASTWRVYE